MYSFYDFAVSGDAHLWPEVQLYIRYKIDVTNVWHYKGQSFRDSRLEIPRMDMKCCARQTCIEYHTTSERRCDDWSPANWSKKIKDFTALYGLPGIQGKRALLFEWRRIINCIIVLVWYYLMSIWKKISTIAKFRKYILFRMIKICKCPCMNAPTSIFHHIYVELDEVYLFHWNRTHVNISPEEKCSYFRLISMLNDNW